MTLRTAHGQFKAESIEDLVQWLRDLKGCPEIMRVVTARCPSAAHGDEPATWFYVEADSAAGVGRLRCLACGHATPVLDSQERWTFPPVWCCSDCGQSIAEVGYGVHATDGAADWLVVAARCVGCGHVAGLTDMTVPGIAIDVFVATL